LGRVFKIVELLVAACIFFAIAVGIYVAKTSTDAEYTLQAFLTTLEVVEEYLREHPGEWPRSWDDLAKQIAAKDHMNMTIADYQERIQIDFSLTRAQVANMSSDHFTAITQRSPNFGPREHNVEWVIKAAQDTGAPLHEAK
jgi:hypothetical protein